MPPGLKTCVSSFSLRLVKVTEAGQVVYKAEKQACRAFPEPQGDGLERGAKRNYQVLDALEFLAEFTQHIPPKGSHLIRYYGWYSNKARGMRRKAAEAEAAAEEGAAPSGDTAEASTRGRPSQAWAMLIKRVYEVDPLCCPKCQGEMKVVAFLEPPQASVIEKILRHCGLWHASRAPPGGGDSVHDGHSQASPDEPGELTLVAEDAVWGEAEGFVDAAPFDHSPADDWSVDDWYRRPLDDDARELTYVDEDTFWSEF
ncbi:MAG: transposase [Phycisphaerae bacterium]